MRTLLNRAGLGAPTFLWIAVLVGCGLMWTLAWPQPAFAETITVNSTADVLDATDDRCTLREAIIAANSDTASGNLGAYPSECAAGNGADTVVFAAAGTYTLTLPGTGEDAAAGGDLDVTAALTLAGRGVDSTTIQAGSASPLPPGNCQDCIDRVLDAFAPLAISDLTLRYGTVELGPGGGLRVNDGSVVAASNIAVLDSVSQFGVGGGIGVLLGGVLTLDGSLVQGNFAAGGSGLFNAGQAALDQVTVSDNAAVDGLGSISSLGTLTVTRSSVISNTAGLRVYAGTATLENSTVSGNQGTGVGAYLGTVRVAHSTVAANASYGLRRLGATLSLSHVIVAGNGDGDCSGGVDSQGYNLAGDPSCALAGPGDLNDVDPALGPLADNGGPTLTHDLLAGSPAIDAGDPAFGGPPFTDQRGTGYTRIAGGRVDIGAYEYDAVQTGPVFTVNSADDVDDGACTASHCSLREAINGANAHPNGEGPDRIEFAIAGPGPHTIRPATPLPAITESVQIDGASQPGASCTPWPPALQIALDGSLDPQAFDGLTLAGGAAGSTVQGLVIGGFDAALHLDAVDDVEIACNVLGPDLAGTAGVGGSLVGILVDGGSGNTVEDNVIAGQDGDGILLLAGVGNRFEHNSIYGNGGLGIDLGGDGVTGVDIGDADGGPNDLQNFPVLQRAVISGTGSLQETLVQGFLLSTPNSESSVELFAGDTCDDSFFGQGQTPLLPAIQLTSDDLGYAPFLVTLDGPLPEGAGVAALATSQPGGSTSEFSRCIRAGANNDSWPNAYEIPLMASGHAVDSQGTASQFISGPGQSRWFRFPVPPNSTVVVSLTDLPANYDLILFRDIAKTYETLAAPEGLGDLTELNAEFAPEMYTPEMYTPEMYTPEMYTPEMYTPEMYTPENFSPEMYTPEIILPEMYTPESFSPEMYTPESFSPEMYTPELFVPEMYTPEVFTPEMYTPDMQDPGQRYFAAAQTQSAVAVSAFDGTADETVVVNSWSETGDFYVRVTGRNGVFDPTTPFTLTATVRSADCSGLTILDPTPDTSGISPGSLETLILADYGRMGAIYPDLTAMQAALNALAAQTNGVVVDVSQYAAINDANAQADANYQCVYAKNLVAYAVKDIVDAYRESNPIRYIVLVGNDDIIPFFRYPDRGLLANESGFVPPVRDQTASQASLKLSNVLSQDTYGAAVELDRRNTSIPVPQVATGRLVERPVEIVATIDAFLSTGGTVHAPSSALVTGYDFLDDGARAVQAELEAGLGAGGSVDSLISAATVAPADAWTADDLRAALLDSGRHDLIFLAGHFSAYSTLAADYATRLLASEVASSAVDMTNSIVFSAGCHSGYNLVNEDGIPVITYDEPDWAQAFARKGALLIAGTGYQYGDTDFVEYSERLYREFARALRLGTGPVSAGDALVRAKQAYLANTAQMRPIHEKVLLESALYGLPMLSVDLPAGRGTPAGEPSIVGGTTPFSTDPGLTLGLAYADVSLAPPITPTVKTLDSVLDGTSVSTLYYQGQDGLIVNPGEPARPVDFFDVGVPGTVLRGAGFRGGVYADSSDVIPLTGAATTELRGIHIPFVSPVFFPLVPWEVNYFDVLADPAGGTTRLAVVPAQYRSNDSSSIDGTMRTFSNLDFRLYYSNNISSYPNATYSVTNVPALATPPVIARVEAQEEGGQVAFRVQVTGDPSAGMQEVWVTWTACDDGGTCSGVWQSVNLTQSPVDSTSWTGSLPPNRAPAADIRYMVQAVNGVGLVSLATNKGSYYVPGIDPGAPSNPPGAITPAPAVETTLTLLDPSGTGPYSTERTFSARLTANDTGQPLTGASVEFGLTTQRVVAATDQNGIATATIRLAGDPTTDTIRVTYAGTPGSNGNPGLAAAADHAPFTISPISTTLTLRTVQPTFAGNGRADLTINLADATGRPLREQTVLLLIEDAGGNLVYAEAIITNLFGNVELLTVPLIPGTYAVEAVFAGVRTVDGTVIDLRSPRYLPSTAQLTLTSNTPPVADAGGPYQVGEGSSVVLDAGGSSDVNPGQALTYAWDLDDDGLFDTSGITTTLSAAPLDGPGAVQVGLRVCDPVVECDDTTAAVTVNNVPPTIQAITNDGPAPPGEPVTVDVAATDPVDPLAYSFDCDGDLVYEIGPQAANTANCTADAPGLYTVNVLVEDGDGGTATASGTYEIAVPTAVALAAFDARVPAGGDYVLVTWETVSEVDNVGFDLYRNTVAEQPASPMASVPSQAPGGTQGATYAYEDHAVAPGQTYWYWLEAIDVNGHRDALGLVSVAVGAPTQGRRVYVPLVAE